MTDQPTAEDLVVHIRDEIGTCVLCGARVPAGLAGAVGPKHEPVCRTCVDRIEPELGKLFGNYRELRRRFKTQLEERPAAIRLTRAAGACGRCGQEVPAGLTMVVKKDPLCRACAMVFDPALAKVSFLYGLVEPLVAMDLLAEMVSEQEREAWRELLSLLLARAKVLRPEAARRMGMRTGHRPPDEAADDGEGSPADGDAEAGAADGGAS